MTTALAVTQQLEACEAVIERGMTTFIEVGNALLRIRDERLYRQEYRDFETYCQTRWAMKRAHAYRLIEAADVVERLSPMGDIPLPNHKRLCRARMGRQSSTAAPHQTKARQAWLGSARHGEACHGSAWQAGRRKSGHVVVWRRQAGHRTSCLGPAGLGWARHGRRGTARRGSVWHGMAGTAGPGSVGHGSAGLG